MRLKLARFSTTHYIDSNLRPLSKVTFDTCRVTHYDFRPKLLVILLSNSYHKARLNSIEFSSTHLNCSNNGLIMTLKLSKGTFTYEQSKMVSRNCDRGFSAPPRAKAM